MLAEPAPTALLLRDNRDAGRACLYYCLTYIVTSPDRMVCSARAWGAGPLGHVRPTITGTRHETWQDSIVRPGGRAQRVAAGGADGAAGGGDRPAGGDRGHCATA